MTDLDKTDTLQDYPNHCAACYPDKPTVSSMLCNKHRATPTPQLAVGQGEELRQAIGDIIYRVHTDGRLQGKAAQDVERWKQEVMAPIDQVMTLIAQATERAEVEGRLDIIGRITADERFKEGDTCMGCLATLAVHVEANRLAQLSTLTTLDKETK